MIFSIQLLQSIMSLLLYTFLVGLIKPGFTKINQLAQTALFPLETVAVHATKCWCETPSIQTFKLLWWPTPLANPSFSVHISFSADWSIQTTVLSP